MTKLGPSSSPPSSVGVNGSDPQFMQLKSLHVRAVLGVGHFFTSGPQHLLVLTLLHGGGLIQGYAVAVGTVTEEDTAKYRLAKEATLTPGAEFAAFAADAEDEVLFDVLAADVA